VHELNDLGLLGDDVNYGHGYEFTDAELGLIASSGGSITVSPSVEMSMALGTFPVLGRAP
jgi:5-methylthioadenosine/S-adenosylhomocysteine deaminase